MTGQAIAGARYPALRAAEALGGYARALSRSYVLQQMQMLTVTWANDG